MTDKTERYRREPEAAEQQARHATNETERSAWCKIAAGWRNLEASELERGKAAGQND